MIVWLTGLPCSGKTTLARPLAKVLDAVHYDGDDLRATPFAADAGFSPEDRERHLLRVGFLAKEVGRFTDVVCSFVSPSEEVRNKLPIDFLVYCKCPVSVCKQRDVKGMWAKAMAGEIQNFTGVSAPFDIPEHANVTVNTHLTSIDDCVWKIFRHMMQVKMHSDKLNGSVV